MSPKLFKIVSISAIAFVAAMSIVNIKNSELSTVKDGAFSNNENTFVTLTPGVDHYFTVGKEGLTFSQLTESGFKLDDNRSVAGYVLTWEDSEKPDNTDRQDSIYYQSNRVWKKFGSRDSFGDEKISNYFVIRTLSTRPSINLNLPTHVTYFGSTKYNSSDRPWENEDISDDFPKIYTELISTSTTNTDDSTMGIYSARFELTAEGGDVYIPKEVIRTNPEKDSKIEPGLNIFIKNSKNNIISEQDAEFSYSVNTSADTDSNFYVIDEGDTERFDLKFVINDVKDDGIYRIMMKGFTYFDSSSYNSGDSRVHDFGSNNRFASENLFIKGGNSSEVGVCNMTRDLSIGSSGTDVVALQDLLVEKGLLSFPDGTAKGYFGSSTQSALAKYQSQEKITLFSNLTYGLTGRTIENGYFGYLTRLYITNNCRG